jgi:hypothetical protein
MSMRLFGSRISFDSGRVSGRGLAIAQALLALRSIKLGQIVHVGAGS